MSSENMTLLDCECLPGFYESDDADSTNSTNSTNSTLADLNDDDVSFNSTYSNDTDVITCLECPADHWCINGEKSECAQALVAPPGSDEPEDCVCPAGLTLVRGQCVDMGACAMDRYADGCDEECTMEVTCSDNGRCIGDGSCDCFPGWSGDDCSISKCPANSKMSSENMTLLDCECLPGFYESDDADSTNSTNSTNSTLADLNDDDVSFNSTYSNDTDVITCLECPADHWCINGEKSECAQALVAPPGSDEPEDCVCPAGLTLVRGQCVDMGACAMDRHADGCDEECTMEVTCSDNGRCIGDGSCDCFPGWSGDDCSIVEGCDEASGLIDDGSGCVCPAGTVFGVDGTCHSCPEGSFKDWDGLDLCEQCPDHSTSQRGSSSSADCKCVTGFVEISPEECVCPAGMGFDFDGSCQPCPSDSYKDWDGLDSCDACPDHSTGDSSGEWCKCMEGFVDDGSDYPVGCVCAAGSELQGDTCQPCPSDSYKDWDGLDSCDACPDHSTGDSSGEWCECMEGFVDDGSDYPVGCVCAAGSELQGDTCQPCPSGTYKDWDGLDSCDACPDHSTGDSSGEWCECMEGFVEEYYGYDHGFYECVCAAGSELQGDTCQPCPSDSYKDWDGLDSCDACPDHSTGDSSGEWCECMEGFVEDITVMIYGFTNACALPGRSCKATHANRARQTATRTGTVWIHATRAPTTRRAIPAESGANAWRASLMMVQTIQ